VESVRTEGEGSVFVLDGEVVSAARKRPAAGEIRVREQYGGSTVAVSVTDEAAELARRTVAAAEQLLGVRLDHARVDQMRLADGRLAVSELVTIEPGLYLDELRGNGPSFAAMVARRLG
jgi:glutathione synthase/RimK-type ligase-like ATP-grasp enzyme